MNDRVGLIADRPPPGHAASARIALHPGGTVPFGSGERVMRLVSGHLEVYAHGAGRRHFLAEFKPGAVLFGGAAALVGVARDAVGIVDLDPADIRSQAADPFKGPEVAALVEQWVAALSAGLALAAPKRPELCGITAGETATVAAGAEAVSARHGVLWVAGDAAARIDFMQVIHASGHALPLTPATWASVSAGLLVGEDTVQILRRSGWMQALAGFHSLIAAVFDAWAAQADNAEMARVERREADTELGLKRANSGFAAILARIGRRRHAIAGTAAYVVLAAVAGETVDAHKAAPATEITNVADLAVRCGYRTREIRLEGAWWRNDRGRLAAVRIADGKPAALLPDRFGRYRLHVPGEPVRRVNAVIAATVSDVAVQILKPLPARPLRARDILAIGVSLCRFDAATLIVASFAASLLGWMLPLALGQVVNVFIPDQLNDGLLRLGLGLAVMALAGTLLRVISDVARLRMDGRLGTDIQTGVIDRVLRLPSRILRMQSSADLALRVMSVEQMRRAVTNTALTAILSGLFGLAGFPLLFVYSPAAALLAVALFLLLLGLAALAGRGQVRQIAIGNAMTANTTTLTLQLIQNITTLRAFSAERRAYTLWARNAAEMRSRNLRSRFVYLLFDAFISSYDLLALAAVFAVLGCIGGDALSIGGYLVFVTTYQGFLLASEGLSRAVVQIMGFKPVMDRARLVLKTAPENPVQARDPGRLSGRLEVSNLCFAYGPGLPDVVKQVSLSILPGQFVALVGPSGSGKTTLTNLILGFDQPSGGVVMFDGQNLALLDKPAVRRQIGVVRQNGRLLAGSLYDNIRGMHDGSLEDVWIAAERAGIGHEIRALPMGMHTVLNEGLSTFSGGQVQRLLLARALVGNPRMLVLDEATSAVDNVTQSIVDENIERLGLTRLVVAHRLTTVRKADVIHFLLDGRIAESGSYDELVQAGGHFARFIHRQTL